MTLDDALRAQGRGDSWETATAAERFGAACEVVARRALDSRGVDLRAPHALFRGLVMVLASEDLRREALALMREKDGGR